jgi:phosphopantothenoylcysteine synthetase/decarboxylase
MSIQLKSLPKLISGIKRKCPNTFLVGFKLLVDSTEKELITAAEQSIKQNDCDIILANDLRDIQNDNHTIHVVFKDKQRGNITLCKNDVENLAQEVVSIIVDQYIAQNRSEEEK